MLPSDRLRRRDGKPPQRKKKPEPPANERKEEHSMDEFPEGFEHGRYRVKPEALEALRMMRSASDSDDDEA
jgi:hypothetical protein